MTGGGNGQAPRLAGTSPRARDEVHLSAPPGSGEPQRLPEIAQEEARLNRQR